jgi:hypothetical protein
MKTGPKTPQRHVGFHTRLLITALCVVLSVEADHDEMYVQKGCQTNETMRKLELHFNVIIYTILIRPNDMNI